MRRNQPYDTVDEPDDETNYRDDTCSKHIFLFFGKVYVLALQCPLSPLDPYDQVYRHQAQYVCRNGVIEHLVVPSFGIVGIPATEQVGILGLQPIRCPHNDVEARWSIAVIDEGGSHDHAW